MNEPIRDDTTEPFPLNADAYDRHAASERARTERTQQVIDAGVNLPAACGLLRQWLEADARQEGFGAIAHATRNWLWRIESAQSNTGASAPIQGE